MKRFSAKSLFSPEFQAYSSGLLTASALLAILLATHAPGESVIPHLSTARFAVAVLAGPKQAAQQAPENAAAKTEETVIASPTAKSNTEVVVPDRPTSLPQAVAAAPDASPGKEVATPVEVAPPAQVSMPGGRLMAADPGQGDTPDPFAIGPQQVYVRLWINEKGLVIRSGIVRHGADPMRDSLILKAIASRTYRTKDLRRIEGSEPIWQMDAVIDYGTSELLP